jgi:hypothetical protein
MVSDTAGSSVVLLRLAYLGVTNAFAVLRLLRSQADALLACDFLETVTLSGARMYAFA